MPGLNAIVKYNSRFAMKADGIAKALKSMNFDDTYRSEKLFDNDHSSVYFSGYDLYPRRQFSIGGNTVFIEGAIYNKSDEEVTKELSKILPTVVSGTGGDDALRAFIADTDGEFVVYYIDEAKSTMIVFNDGLGRLPVYYHAAENGCIFARALKFITKILPSISFDDNAMMEYFLFSIPLGDRTIIKDVFRLRPYSLFIVDYAAGKFQKRSLRVYNFDERWESKPIKSYVDDLHDLFMAGIHNRAAKFNDRKQILTLSGGLDSRAVLVGLLKDKVDFQSISFLDFFHFLGRDKPVVKTLAEMYGLDIDYIDLIEENIPYFERVVDLRDGTSPMGTMGSVLYSMEIIAKKYGRNLVLYVGDEGNYITAPRHGAKQIDSIKDVVKTIIKSNSLSVFPIEEVAGIFGRSPKEVMDYLCEYFSSYPEKDNSHKIDHFYLWERSFSSTMEGEDRIRSFFWAMTPHYSTQYFDYALKIKNEYLDGWQIYRELLKALDRKSASVKYANFGIALDSPLMPIYVPLRALATSNNEIRRSILSILRMIRKPMSAKKKSKEGEYIADFRNYLIRLIDENPPVGTYMKTLQLKESLNQNNFLFKMYVSGNLLKYISSVESA